jgi:hypothetical protein
MLALTLSIPVPDAQGSAHTCIQYCSGSYPTSIVIAFGESGKCIVLWRCHHRSVDSPLVNLKCSDEGHERAKERSRVTATAYNLAIPVGRCLHKEMLIIHTQQTLHGLSLYDQNWRTLESVARTQTFYNHHC